VEVRDVVGAGKERHQLADSPAHKGWISYAGCISKHDRVRAFSEVEIYDLRGVVDRIVATHWATVHRARATDHLDSKRVAATNDFGVFLHCLRVRRAEIEEVVLLRARDHENDLSGAEPFLLTNLEALKALQVRN
jgi:hypothetical protein